MNQSHPQYSLPQLKKRLHNIYIQDPNIVFAYLFGSVITGKQHQWSDIDVGLFLRESDIRALKSVLNITPDDIPIQITLLNDLAPIIALNVIREGILLFSRDENTRKNFVYKVMKEGLDYKETYENFMRITLEGIK